MPIPRSGRPWTLCLLLALPLPLAAASWDATSVQIWQDSQGRWFSDLPVQEAVPLGRPATLGDDGGVEFDATGLTEAERRYVYQEAMRRLHHDGKRTVGGVWDGRSGTWRRVRWELSEVMAQRFLTWREAGAYGEDWEIDRRAEAHAVEWLRGREPREGAPRPGFGLGDL